jgi:hypothetical protein
MPRSRTLRCRPTCTSARHAAVNMSCHTRCRRPPTPSGRFWRCAPFTPCFRRHSLPACEREPSSPASTSSRSSARFLRRGRSSAAGRRSLHEMLSRRHPGGASHDRHQVLGDEARRRASLRTRPAVATPSAVQAVRGSTCAGARRRRSRGAARCCAADARAAERRASAARARCRLHCGASRRAMWAGRPSQNSRSACSSTVESRATAATGDVLLAARARRAHGVAQALGGAEPRTAVERHPAALATPDRLRDASLRAAPGSESCVSRAFLRT